jgi:micrococcal nuclease
MRLIPALVSLALLAIATPALADPCEAIDAKGRFPAWLAPGQAFAGTVRFVIDGDGLCVGDSEDPARWVEIRLEDFDAPELREPGGWAAKRMLVTMALDRPVICRGWRTNHDRLVATCSLEGETLGDRMRRAGIAEGGY